MPSTSSYSVGATLRLRMELAEKLLEVAIEEAREPNVINGIPDVNDMAPAQLVVHTAEVKREKILADEERDLSFSRSAELSRRVEKHLRNPLIKRLKQQKLEN